MKLLVGLGNPGAKYEQTRHNIGFFIVDQIAKKYSSENWRKKFQGVVCNCDINTFKVLILKPETFMNNSGLSVLEASKFFKINPADIIVIHDDLDLQPGQLRIKTAGGHAGHNGLKSIHQLLGPSYNRIRIGIGHPGDRDKVSSFVLSNFLQTDKSWLGKITQHFLDEFDNVISGNHHKFVSLYELKLIEKKVP